MFSPVDVRGTLQGLTEEEAKSVGKFEMMHCKVKEYCVNMNGWAWVSINNGCSARKGPSESSLLRHLRTTPAP
jgi:hypothetical protein